MMRFPVVLCLLALVLTGGTSPTAARSAAPPVEDSSLAAVTASLAAVHATATAHLLAYRGDQNLTDAKNALRQWVEAQLTTLAHFSDERQFAKALNTRLAHADLFCETDANPDGKRCEPDIEGVPSQYSAYGFAEEVQLMRQDFGRYLVLTTGVGILCGYDESAYVYEWRNQKWTSIFVSEQNDYTDGKYHPQMIQSILLSPSNVAWNEPVSRPPIVLTLGINPYCQSNWQALYARIWRVGTGTSSSARPLLDREEGIFLGGERPVAGSVGSHDVLFEFTDRSIDLDSFSRAVVRHFKVQDDGKVVRIGPVALNPRDFVDEWLVRPWSESGEWLDGKDIKSLEHWHALLHKDFVSGSFLDGSGRCRADRTLWQIGVDLAGKDAGGAPVTLYFQVRWLPPYQFTLVDITRRPHPNCDEAIDQSDLPGTLFPAQARQ